MTELDAQVRAADIDRWLSSRFVADEAARADLIALYAFVCMVLAPGILVFLMAQSAFIRGLTSGATKG